MVAAPTLQLSNLTIETRRLRPPPKPIMNSPAMLPLIAPSVPNFRNNNRMTTEGSPLSCSSECAIDERLLARSTSLPTHSDASSIGRVRVYQERSDSWTRQELSLATTVIQVDLGSLFIQLTITCETSSDPPNMLT